jgi:hypothetical protein
MGCDIYSHAEIKRQGSDTWEKVGEVFPLSDFDKEWRQKLGDDLYPGKSHEFTYEPFSDRHYGLFGWLANVRNYSAVEPLSEARGFPDDASPEVRQDYEGWGVDAHTPSWLDARELLEFDYEQVFEDRRVTRQIGPNMWHGGITGEPGEGEVVTYKEFLGGELQRTLQVLRQLFDQGEVRVVFWFDN